MTSGSELNIFFFFFNLSSGRGRNSSFCKHARYREFLKVFDYWLYNCQPTRLFYLKKLKSPIELEKILHFEATDERHSDSILHSSDRFRIQEVRSHYKATTTSLTFAIFLYLPYRFDLFSSLYF